MHTTIAEMWHVFGLNAAKDVLKYVKIIQIFV